jgi:hypothetical protein
MKAHVTSVTTVISDISSGMTLARHTIENSAAERIEFLRKKIKGKSQQIATMIVDVADPGQYGPECRCYAPLKGSETLHDIKQRFPPFSRRASNFCFPGDEFIHSHNHSLKFQTRARKWKHSHPMPSSMEHARVLRKRAGRIHRYIVSSHNYWVVNECSGNILRKIHPGNLGRSRGRAFEWTCLWPGNKVLW